MHNNNFPGMQPNYWAHGVNELRNVQNTCQKYMNYHVIGQMADGTQIEGIIEDRNNNIEKERNCTYYYKLIIGFGSLLSFIFLINSYVCGAR